MVVLTRKLSMTSLWGRFSSPRSKTLQKLMRLGGSMKELMSPSAKSRMQFQQDTNFSKSAPTLGSVLCKWEDKIFESCDDTDSESARSNACTPVKQQESLERSLKSLQNIEDEMKELKLLMADSETFKDVAELEQAIRNLVQKKHASLSQKLDKVEFEGNSTVDSQTFAMLKERLNSSLTRMTGVRKCPFNVSPVRHEKVEILNSQCPSRKDMKTKKKRQPTWESRVFNSNEDLEMPSNTLPRFSFTPAAADRIVSAAKPAQIRFTKMENTAMSSTCPQRCSTVMPRPEYRHLPRLQKRQLVGSVAVANGPPLNKFQIKNAAGMKTKKAELKVDIIPSSNPRELHDVDDAPDAPPPVHRQLSTVHNESVIRDVRLVAKKMSEGAFLRFPGLEMED